ncbi:uncharacterized protein PgNI_04271 [Pyricularia grisea]|uniref:Uncharacterized protein n=1 Tax=Pyricularia grisea TaxID=148305 RepID=A0A6P8BBI9_PYRGI|nr:uncharacterized protein PgNI_04271 [Pyricularia grisea]TLD13190.1 hypothetical protein PgNI_04271 [Pyricularia grisea]
MVVSCAMRFCMATSVDHLSSLDLGLLALDQQRLCRRDWTWLVSTLTTTETTTILWDLLA